MKPPMKKVDASTEFKAFRLEMLAVLKKHTGKMSADEMLAVAAYMVGQLIAMQDQRTMTSEMAMEVVGMNIELCNEHAAKESMASPHGSA